MFTTFRGFSTRADVILCSIFVLNIFFSISSMEYEEQQNIKFKPLQLIPLDPDFTYTPPSLKTACIRSQPTALLKQWARLPEELQAEVSSEIVRLMHNNPGYILTDWRYFPACIQESVKADNLNRHALYYITAKEDIDPMLKLLEEAGLTREDIVYRRDCFNESIISYQIKAGNYETALGLIEKLTDTELTELEKFISPSKKAQRISPSHYARHTSKAALYCAACMGQLDIYNTLHAKVKYDLFLPEQVRRVIQKKIEKKFSDTKNEESTDSNNEDEIDSNPQELVDEAGRSPLFHATDSKISSYLQNHPKSINDKDVFRKTSFEYWVFTDQQDKVRAFIYATQGIPLPFELHTKILNAAIKTYNQSLVRSLLEAYPTLAEITLLKSLKQALKKAERSPSILELFLNHLESDLALKPLEKFNRFEIGFVDQN